MTTPTPTPNPPLLASPEDLSEWLGLEPTDPELVRLLQRASDRFRAEVDHQVHYVEDDVVDLDAYGGRSLLLPSKRVTDVSEVAVYGTPITGFELSKRMGAIRRAPGQLWPEGLGCVRVTFSHGYNPIPGDIQDVVIDQARMMSVISPGVKSIQVGGQSVTLASESSATQGTGPGVSRAWRTAVAKYSIGAGDRA